MKTLWRKERQNKNANTQMKSQLANSGRIAGMGIDSDDYSEESGYRGYQIREFADRCRLPHDHLTQEQWESLNSPVTISCMPESDAQTPEAEQEDFV